jgi:hypothetical protein
VADAGGEVLALLVCDLLLEHGRPRLWPGVVEADSTGASTFASRRASRTNRTAHGRAKPHGYWD